MVPLGRGRGFTLVELLIVIIIIGILASVAIPLVRDASRRAKESAVRDQISSLRKAVSYFHEDTECYPLTLADLSATTAPAEGYNRGGQTKAIKPGDFNGPYLEGQPIPGEMAGWINYKGDERGRIWCPLTGTDLAGNLFSSW